MEVKPGYLCPKGYKQTEVGIIPEEWDVSPVRQKGEVVTGKALAVNAPGLQRPYLRTKNVFDGRIDIDDVLTMPMTDEQFAQFQIRNGDVLLNEGQSIELVGRCAIYQDEFAEPCGIQNALLRFRARPGVSEKFASYLFRHCQQTGVFARIALQTTSVAHLGGSRFEQLRLAWPTEEEQRAIATALSDVDGLLGGLDRLIAKKRDLKQAAMQQLLTGQTRLPGFHGDWEVRKLGELCDYVDGVTTSGGDLGYLEIGDVNVETKSYDVAQKEKLSVRGAVQVPSGTLLISTVRPTRGAIVVTKSSLHVSSAFCRVRPANGLLFHLVCQPKFLAYLGENSFGGTYPTCRDETILGYETPLPSDPAEQTAMAEVLTEMDEELAALEQRREKTRALKQAMMQELLTGRIRLV